jgi:hypothetical protein
MTVPSGSSVITSKLKFVSYRNEHFVIRIAWRRCSTDKKPFTYKESDGSPIPATVSTDTCNWFVTPLPHPIYVKMHLIMDLPYIGTSPMWIISCTVIVQKLLMLFLFPSCTWTCMSVTSRHIRRRVQNKNLFGSFFLSSNILGNDVDVFGPWETLT